MKVRKYAGVAFANGENEVVPKSWLYEKSGRSYCKWPKNVTKIMATKRKVLQPGKWEAWAVENVLVESGTYLSATLSMQFYLMF